MSAPAGARPLVPPAPVAARLPAPPQGAPAGFVPHVYERRFSVSAPRDRVWGWLEDPDTFVRGQIWPFRVEFVSPDPAVPPGFHVGGINLHHGPLMCFAGILTEIREGEYRDLHYFHGSYLLGLRWIRPTRLEFAVADAASGGTDVTLRVTSRVRSGLARPWTVAQRAFWSRLPRWMARSLDARLRSAG